VNDAAGAAVGVLVGLIAGLVLAYALLRSSARTQARGEFQTWRAKELRSIRRKALAESRAEAKERVGEDLAADVEQFPFAAADARFLGDPIAFVVFDGHTEVKDRSMDILRTVAFVAITAGAEATPDSLLVEECLADGRVEWLTITAAATEH
jgi:predicted Holliday junction resolvase-like endonuclease